MSRPPHPTYHSPSNGRRRSAMVSRCRWGEAAARGACWTANAATRSSASSAHLINTGAGTPVHSDVRRYTRRPGSGTTCSASSSCSSPMPAATWARNAARVAASMAALRSSLNRACTAAVAPSRNSRVSSRPASSTDLEAGVASTPWMSCAVVAPGAADSASKPSDSSRADKVGGVVLVRKAFSFIWIRCRPSVRPTGCGSGEGDRNRGDESGQQEQVQRHPPALPAQSGGNLLQHDAAALVVEASQELLRQQKKAPPLQAGPREERCGGPQP